MGKTVKKILTSKLIKLFVISVKQRIGVFLGIIQEIEILFSSQVVK